MSQRARTVAPAAAILFVALVVRVALVVHTDDVQPVADSAVFDRHASFIADHGHYPPSELTLSPSPTAFRPPAYPYLLAATYRLAGHDQTAGRLLGALLGALTVALLGLLARLLWDRRAALWTMAIASVYPTLIVVGSSLLSEALFTPLVLLSTVALVLYLRAPESYRWAVVAGITLGLATLTRSNGLALVPLSAVVIKRGGDWRAVAALVTASVLVMVPWVIRNAATFGAPILTTQTGYTMQGTYNDLSRTDPVNPGAWRVALVAPYEAIIRDRSLDEAEIDVKLRSEVLSYIGEHPAYAGEVLLYNTLRMLELTGREREHQGARESGVGPGISDAARYAFWLVGLVAIVGFVAAPQLRQAPLWLWLIPAMLLISLVPFNSSARYREPADPFICLAAGVTIAAAAGRLRTVRRP